MKLKDILKEKIVIDVEVGKPGNVGLDEVESCHCLFELFPRESAFLFVFNIFYEVSSELFL